MKALVLSSVLSLVAAHAMADTYKVDAAKSDVQWKATKKLAGGHNGHVKVKEGSVEIGKKNEVKAATVVVDMKTITNEDLKDSPEYQQKLVGHLSSADFFDVEKNPTATFKLNSITKKGKEFIAKGDLTFIGKTNPVEFPVNFKVEKGVATGEGTLKLDRTKWGLKYGSGNFFKELAADKIINDEFELTFKVVANK